jgi:subtilisin family serine protease
VDGSGITVAFVDTGLGGVPRHVFGRVSDASIDLMPMRERGTLDGRHGEQTAGVAGGAFDGAGTMGVAFGATLLAIRADIDGSCETQCAVRGKDLARGIHYALDQGARVIAVPLVGRQRLRSVEPALERAAAAGAIIVAAAGNDGSAAPAWPARYAADPRFARSIIVAGASTIRGAVSGWSSKAAGAEERYIVAPGENVLVNCDKRYCNLVSGTSLSAAYVAGALSLVMAAHPTLSRGRCDQRDGHARRGRGAPRGGPCRGEAHGLILPASRQRGRR